MQYENRIKTILMDLGVDPALKGFGFLAEAIKFTLEDKKNKKMRPTMKLYRDIAAVFNVSQPQVSRAIGHSIDVAFSRDNKLLYNVFKGLISADTGKVATSTFIAVIAEKIIMNEN